jgi:hypothetical protein
MSKTRFRTIIIIAFALTAAAAQAEDALKNWAPGFGLRLFGLDLDFTSSVPKLLPIGKTELLAAFGGGYVSRGYYRNADGTRSAAALGKLNDVDADMWLRATQYLDGDSHLRAALFIRGESLMNARDSGSAASLLALSGLPDAAGFAELGAGAAFGYTLMDKKTSADHEIGLKADLSYEFSYDFFPATMNSALVHEVALEFSGFLPLVDTDAVSLVLCEYLLGSALMGDAPEHRLSRIGGNRFSAYKALGGLVRGSPDYSGDGRLKAADNLELRLALPALFKKVVIPGLTLFADTGIADDGHYASDPGTFRLSSGAIVTVTAFGFTLGAGGVYEFMTGSFNPYVALGTQF